MNEVLKAAADLQNFCEAEEWSFCIIGGLAVLRWGEPRETVDVDVTLLAGFGSEGKYINGLLKQYTARIPEAAEFAFQNRVLLLKAASGVGLDVALGGLGFEERAIERSTKFSFSKEIELRTCSADDLIIFKAFAARPKDWIDIDGILVRQSKTLDWTYIEKELAPLVELKGAPEILHELRRRIHGKL